MYKIYHSRKFDKDLDKFDKRFLIFINKTEDDLSINPYIETLLRVEWFRERRYDKFRIYFLIYEDLEAVLMAGISEKKNQQKAINTIYFLRHCLKEELMNLINKE
jgi:mRNA-degrading endonuclease RelE of RelBE toxin-antitoxin system